MAQEKLILLRCSVCGNKNYYTYRNKKKFQDQAFKLKLKKHCPECETHTEHSEGKVKK